MLCRHSEYFRVEKLYVDDGLCIKILGSICLTLYAVDIFPTLLSIWGLEVYFLYLPHICITRKRSFFKAWT